MWHTQTCTRTRFLNSRLKSLAYLGPVSRVIMKKKKKKKKKKKQEVSRQGLTAS